MPSFIAAGAVTLPGEALVQIAILLAAAMALGALAVRFGQSPMVGYLVAGFILGGPGSLGLIKDTEAVGVLGELGVALLLFAVGLELPLDKLKKVGMRSFNGGILQTLVIVVGGTAVGVAAGFDKHTAFIVSAGLALSSTAVTLRTLGDRSELEAPHGTASLGVLIAQDIAVVLILLVVPELAGEPSVASVLEGAARAAATFGLVVVATIVVERVAIRQVFSSRHIHAAREQIVAVSLAAAAAAIGACALLDLSPALGGFVAGTVMAGSHYSNQVRSEIAPIRMVLTVLFFSWVGTLADAGWVASHLPLVVAFAVMAVVVKAVVAAGSLRVLGLGSRAAIPAGLATAQLGEFSFAVFALAKGLDLISPDTFQLLVGASILTIIASPTLTKVGVQLAEHFVARKSPVVTPEKPKAGPRALVVGLGPAGMKVCEALAAAGAGVVAMELNPRPAEAPDGVEVQFGDAAREEVLESLGEIATCIVTIPDPRGCVSVIEAVKRQFPDAEVIARVRYHVYVEEILAAGADVIVDEEYQVGSVLAARAVERFAPVIAKRRRPTWRSNTP